MTGTGRALFLIKFVHTLVFLIESAAILYILYSGLFDVRDGWLVVAVILVLAETAVFFLNGRHCPLTGWAQRLGDQGGHDLLADIFLPKWAPPLITPVCGTLAVIGLALVSWRVLAG